jgi:hypothetical protein
MFANQKTFGVEEIFSRSCDNLRILWRELMAYIAVVIALALASPYVGGGPGGIAGFWAGWGVYFGGQYWLFWRLLSSRGLLETESFRFFSFCGLAIVLIVPIMVGTIFFILPGLFLSTRWIAAPAFIVARGDGVLSAAGHSWQRVQGATLPVALIFSVMIVIWMIITALIGGLGHSLKEIESFSAMSPAEALQFHILPLLLLSLSVAVYELTARSDTTVEDVFG